MISCIEKSLFLYRKFPQNQLGPALTIEPERDQAVALLYRGERFSFAVRLVLVYVELVRGTFLTR